MDKREMTESFFEIFFKFCVDIVRKRMKRDVVSGNGNDDKYCLI